MHTSLFITCAMVTIEIHRFKWRFLSLVIYRLPRSFDANIGKLYIKLKLYQVLFLAAAEKLVEYVFKIS